MRGVTRIAGRGVRGPLPGAQQRRQAPLAVPRAHRDRGRARRLGRGHQRGARSVSLAVAFVVERRLAPDRRRPRPARRRWRLVGDARRDLLGRQRRHRQLRHQRHRHGALGHRGQGRRPAALARSSVAAVASACPPAPARSSRPTTSTASGASSRASWPRATASSRAAGATTCRSPSASTRRAIWPSPGRSARRSGPDTEMIVDVVALAGWDSSHAIRMARRLDDDVPPLLAGGPAARAGPRRLSPPPRGRGRAHLHRREGLARGALPGPHRVGGRRRDHGRPGQGRGRHRHLAGHRHGRRRRSSPGTPTPGRAR